MTEEALDGLISSDSHVNPPVEMWRDYLPAKFRDAAPRMEHADDGDFSVFEGRRRPIQAGSAMAGRPPQEFAPTVRRQNDLRSGGWEPAARIEDQDVEGVEAEILFGSVGEAPLMSQDPALTRAGFTAYNRWLADFCSYAPSRLIGVGCIPCDDPDDALGELELVAQLGMRGVVISHTPGTGSWTDDTWAPFLRRLVELDLPAHLHVSVGTRRTIGDIASRGDLFMNYLVRSKLDLPVALGAFVYGGLLEKYPGLKLVSVEAQIGWVPFWKQYLDHVYERHRYWTGNHLAELPSTYADRQIWFTFMDDVEGLARRHECGIDRIMWSNDYPHSESTWPHSRKVLAEQLEGVPEDEVRKIVRDNCAALYGL